MPTTPPLSPPLAARHNSAVKSNNQGGRARRGGAAYTITEECERLFCETLKHVFLGEGNSARQDSLVTGMQNHHRLSTGINDYGVDIKRYTDRLTPSPEMDEGFFDFGQKGLVTDWLEIYDYVGGNRFRGFVAEKNGEKAMCVFFDQSVIGSDLKAGLMAVMELCEVSQFSCSRLIVCLDRHTGSRAMSALTKDLGWIGFQLATLNDFTDGDEITSDQWLFMDMEV